MKQRGHTNVIKYSVDLQNLLWSYIPEHTQEDDQDPKNSNTI